MLMNEHEAAVLKEINAKGGAKWAVLAMYRLPIVTTVATVTAAIAKAHGLW